MFNQVEARIKHSQMSFFASFWKVCGENKWSEESAYCPSTSQYPISAETPEGSLNVLKNCSAGDAGVSHGCKINAGFVVLKKKLGQKHDG